RPPPATAILPDSIFVMPGVVANPHAVDLKILHHALDVVASFRKPGCARPSRPRRPWDRADHRTVQPVCRPGRGRHCTRQMSRRRSRPVTLTTETHMACKRHRAWRTLVVAAVLMTGLPANANDRAV